MSEVITTRSGDTTLRINGKYLHSAFDPWREAERFVDTLTLGTPRCILLLGSGLGYVGRALRLRFPRARLVTVALFAVAPLRSKSVFNDADAHWDPESGDPFSVFLENTVDEIETLSIAVVEWKSGTAVEPERSDALRHEISAFVRRTQSGLLSLGAQGPRRMRNAVVNLQCHRRSGMTTLVERHVSAALVVASGPSLEHSLPAILHARKRLLVIATGSALRALARTAIVPDLVVVTESSPYAALHLNPLCTLPYSRIPILAPVSVTPSALSMGNPVAFFLHQELAESLGRPPSNLRIPEVGSVSLSAIELARLITDAPIVVAGLDFGWFDGRSHVRPHLALSWHHALSSRLHPRERSAFEALINHERSGSRWSRDRTLRTYAEWFFSHGVSRSAPVYSIAPAPLVEAALPVLSARQLAERPIEHTARLSTPNGDTGAGRGHSLALDTLEKWDAILDDQDRSHLLRAEPLELLKTLAIRELLAWAADPENTALKADAVRVARLAIARLGELAAYVNS